MYFKPWKRQQENHFDVDCLYYVRHEARKDILSDTLRTGRLVEVKQNTISIWTR